MCDIEQAFVSNKYNKQKSMGFKSEDEGGHIFLLQNFEKWRDHHSEFCLTCEKVVFIGLLTSVCGLSWRQKTVLCHTQVWRLWNGLWLDNEPKYPRNTNVQRWIIFKEDLRRLLRLRETISINEVVCWFLCIFSIILHNYFVIYAHFELLIKQKKRSPSTCCSLCISTCWKWGKVKSSMTTLKQNTFRDLRWIGRNLIAIYLNVQQVDIQSISNPLMS